MPNTQSVVAVAEHTRDYGPILSQSAVPTLMDAQASPQLHLSLLLPPPPRGILAL